MLVSVYWDWVMVFKIVLWIHGFGSSTRAIWSGGGNTGGSITANTIDFVTIATTSNATDFGDATVAALARARTSSSQQI